MTTSSLCIPARWWIYAIWRLTARNLRPATAAQFPGRGTTRRTALKSAVPDLTLDGNFTSNFTYFIQAQADEGATPGLLDAYGKYHFPIRLLL